MSRAKTPTTEQRPLCCVTLDLESYLLPFADGQKLVELMTRAVPCRPNYIGGKLREEFVVTGDARRVNLQVVMPDQVRKPPPDDASPRSPRAPLALPPGATP